MTSPKFLRTPSSDRDKHVSVHPTDWHMCSIRLPAFYVKACSSLDLAFLKRHRIVRKRPYRIVYSTGVFQATAQLDD